MAITNNITRMLDHKRIRYTAFELPPDKISAIETAQRLKVNTEIVYKSIVAVRPTPGGKPIVAVIPGKHQLDLKALAEVLKEKKITLPSMREAEHLTGMQAGGISPLGLVHRGFTIIIDQNAINLDEIHISGGQRGLNIRIGVKDLIQLTNARTAAISVPGTNEEEG